MSAVEQGLRIFSWVALGYYLAINAIYLILVAIAWRSVTHHLHARSYAGVDEAFASPLTPPVSLLVPAFNERAGIVESVHSLLALRYPEHEVIVVNDGSTDGTLEALREAFELRPVRRAVRDALPTARVRGIYVSRRHLNLVVIDKENGGKADALNCAINAARYPYVCSIDADSILEEDALLRVAKPILDDPELVVATGGIVRIANGCRIDRGRVSEIRLPRNRLATMQVVEYLRAFLVGRVGWSGLSSLLIISGAFGFFRRSLVEAVGGYRTDTVGEDVELVVRLHRYLRERREPYRIDFVPDPVCWTEVPEDLRTLGRQRRRWQRGMAETLWRHRAVMGRPRYGVLGLFGLPYFVLFELLGPLVEVPGYVAVAVALAMGVLSLPFFLAFLAVSVLLGVLLSVSALALEELGFRRYRVRGDVARLVLFALLENLGYRQLTAFWRLRAFLDLARRRRDWGSMQRRGFGLAVPASGSEPDHRVSPA